jgi:hypothetical protein
MILPRSTSSSSLPLSSSLSSLETRSSRCCTTRIAASRSSGSMYASEGDNGLSPTSSSSQSAGPTCFAADTGLSWICCVAPSSPPPAATSAKSRGDPTRPRGFCLRSRAEATGCALSLPKASGRSSHSCVSLSKGKRPFEKDACPLVDHAVSLKRGAELVAQLQKDHGLKVRLV